MSQQRLRFFYMLEVTQQQGMRAGKEVRCLHRHLERNNFSTEEGIHEKGGHPVWMPSEREALLHRKMVQGGT